MKIKIRSLLTLGFIIQAFILPACAQTAVVLNTLKSFNFFPNGAIPYAGLVQGNDGNFYGTTEHGGIHGGFGTVFKISTNGELTRLYSFTGANDGAFPRAALVQGSDGYLYGTTANGGTVNIGTVFKISTNGVLNSLYSFTGGYDGKNPNELVQGSDGYLYGTTTSSGTNNYGTVFKITTNGVLTSLYSFGAIQDEYGDPLDGAFPRAALVQGSDGYLYGTTTSSGTNDYGTVFKISTNGMLTSLYSFTGTNDGAYPFAALVQGSDGYLYGTTGSGGTNDAGTVFRISTNGMLTSLYSFTGTNDGSSPDAALVQGSDGYFYGTTIFVAGTNGNGTVFKISTNGVLTSLYSFTGVNDGARPNELVQGRDGYLYGTTYQGGTNGNGTVFKISTNGVLTSLYSFTGANDGENPRAALARSSDGNFYGTTYQGGTHGGYGTYGTMFKITTNGVLTSIYSFMGGDDGAYPLAALMQDSDGYLYGTTYAGGTNGNGTVFKISTNGELTRLYSFTGANDGAFPRAALVQGSDGYLYGTTAYGSTNGFGTVFKISTSGMLTSLYSFTGTNDGAYPFAALVQGNDRCLYGTTGFGGTNGFGTVFKISTNGVLTSLYSFTGTNDGAYPITALVQSSDGYFYGTTYAGGTNGNGTVFKISTNGVLTSLYFFRGANDGASPNELMQGSDGYFYGTTSSGGTNGGYGTVFKISTHGVLISLYIFTGDDDGASPYAGLVQGTDGNFYGTTYSGGAGKSGTVFQLTILPIVQPQLSITHSGANVVLTWPASATGFNLESATNLVSPIVWNINSQSPIVINGQNVVTNPLPGKQIFFRLRH